MRILLMMLLLVGSALAEPPRGWVKGKGYGWIWGPSDEVGALNAINTGAHRVDALKLVKTGKTYTWACGLTGPRTNGPDTRPPK